MRFFAGVFCGCAFMFCVAVITKSAMADSYDKSLQPIKTEQLKDISYHKVYRMIDYPQDNTCYILQRAANSNISCVKGTR